MSAEAKATRVATPVILLGVTSMLTDISSEMVATILPLYLTVSLGLSPLAYGLVDGLYQGVTVLVRIGGGVTADRTRRPKAVAVFGYALSAVTKLALLPATALASISAVITLDRAGKGIRTAPRDALIAASSAGSGLGRAFGVHRALDTVGAMLGPLVAFALLAIVPGGYDVVFVTSFCFAVLAVAVLVVWVPDLRPPRPSSSQPGLARQVGSLLKKSTYQRTLVAAGALAAVTVSDGFLYLVLQRGTDLPTEMFPLLFVGTTFVYFLLAVPLGRLADRIGASTVFVSGHVALLGAYLCAASALDGFTKIVACLILLGTYYAATDGVLAALTVPMLPEGLRSTGLAAIQTVTAGGRFAAAIMFGAMWGVFGPSGALTIFILAMIIVIPFAAIMLRQDPRPRTVRP